ncbi:MAG: hypothetical protein HY817_04120 [Candidatus Abawacabacteria bacterium]|nr:hypothetical protein [Candidatus Abawacabacteria bacterium]
MKSCFLTDNFVAEVEGRLPLLYPQLSSEQFLRGRLAFSHASAQLNAMFWNIIAVHLTNAVSYRASILTFLELYGLKLECATTRQGLYRALGNMKRSLEIIDDEPRKYEKRGDTGILENYRAKYGKDVLSIPSSRALKLLDRAITGKKFDPLRLREMLAIAFQYEVAETIKEEMLQDISDAVMQMDDDIKATIVAVLEEALASHSA